MLVHGPKTPMKEMRCLAKETFAVVWTVRGQQLLLTYRSTSHSVSMSLSTFPTNGRPYATVFRPSVCRPSTPSHMYCG